MMNSSLLFISKICASVRKNAKNDNFSQQWEVITAGGWTVISRILGFNVGKPGPALGGPSCFLLLGRTLI